MLSVFGSIYICERTFSLMRYRKSKYIFQLAYDRLNVILRISTTKIKHTILNWLMLFKLKNHINFYFVFLLLLLKLCYYIPR